MRTIVKTMFSALVMVSAFSSCTDKYKSLAEANQPPVLKLSKEVLENRLNDTITDNGKIYLIANDYNNNLEHFKLINPNPEKVKVFYSTTSDHKSFLPVIGDTTKLFIVIKEHGQYNLKFRLLDRFNAVAEKSLVVKSRDNYEPVARFEAIEIGKNEFKIDGSKSVDPDGRIVAYHFNIDGTEINSFRPIVNHIFYSPGVKTVKLSVKDDAGKVSAVLSKTITIQ